MMYVKAILILVTFSLFLNPATIDSSQELPQAQRVVLENPEVITLEFAPLIRQVSENRLEKLSGPFEPGSKIVFKLMATNTSLIELVVRGWDTYAQNKPRLFRDNQELAYREDKGELIKARHTKDSEPISVRGIKLNPNEQKFLQIFSLDDWYEPLGPGHYVLSTQHRFIQGGKWVESAAIVFEVRDLTK